MSTNEERHATSDKCKRSAEAAVAHRYNSAGRELRTQKSELRNAATQKCSNSEHRDAAELRTQNRSPTAEIMKSTEMEEILEIDFLEFKLMPKAPIEKFWEALWLGIRPFF